MSPASSHEPARVVLSGVTGVMPATFKISLFPAPATTSTRPTLREVTLDELVKLLTTHERRRNKDGRGWSGATYKPGTTRANANVIEWSVAGADFDHLSMDDYMELRAGLVEAGLAFIIYSTFNSTPEDFRFRVAIPLTKPVPMTQYTDVWHRINGHLFGGRNDPQTKDASRMLFTPAAPEGVAVVAEYVSGGALDWEQLPEAPAYTNVSANGTVSAGKDVGIGRQTLEFLLFGADVGQQRGAAVKATRSLLAAGKSIEETAAKVWQGLQASPIGDERWPWTCEDALKIAQDLASKPAPPLETWSALNVRTGPTVSGDCFSPETKAHQNGRAVGESTPADTDPAPERPLIKISGRDTRDVAEDGIRALLAANKGEPHVFTRAGEPVRVLKTEKGRPFIDTLTRDALFHELVDVGEWVKFDARSKEWRPASPPDDVVRYISGHGALPLPPLEGLTETPIVRPNGEIITTPGYDPITKLVYRPSAGLNLTEIPAEVSAVDAAKAASTLINLIEDFPFADDRGASRAHALAFLLTLSLHSAIDGPRPLFVIDKNSPGAGATLLIEAIGIAIHGRAPGMTALPADDTELEKRITSLVREGGLLNVFDNCDRPLEHASLSQVLTATEWLGRVLGQTQTARYPNRATWAANGVNVSIRGDVARRSCLIRMVAEESQPWRLEAGQQKFRHPNLLAWAKEQRGSLITAALTMARRWFQAGQPPPSTPVLGKFEEWCRVIGGILEASGVTGFLANLDELYANVDSESPEWLGFLTTWAEVIGPAILSPKEIEAKIRASDGARLLEALPSDLAIALNDPRGSFVRRLGKALAKRADRRYGERKLHIVRGGTAAQTRWRVAVGFDGLDGFSPTATREMAGCDSYIEGQERNPLNPRNPTSAKPHFRCVCGAYERTPANPSACEMWVCDGCGMRPTPCRNRSCDHPASFYDECSCHVNTRGT
jgi:hypothetical protein